MLELPASKFSCTDDTKATDLELSNIALPDTSYEEPEQWGIIVIGGGGGGGSPRVTTKINWCNLKNLTTKKIKIEGRTNTIKNKHLI